MPTIVTKGAMAAQGFGMSQGGGNDGTKAIFAIGSTTPSSCLSAVRNKYTYATCSSTACGVGSASVASTAGGNAGNGSRAIMQIGYTAACGGSTIRNKYTYATCVSTTSGVAAASSGVNGAVAVGNSTRGIFTAGIGARNKYTYASCTSVGVAGPTVSSDNGSAAGNCSLGFFVLGYDYTLPGNGKKRDKFTYASCTSTAVADLAQASTYGAAAGNNTRGIFARGLRCCGIRTSCRFKVSYPSCTVITAGVAGISGVTNSDGVGAAGNSTRGIYQMGQTNLATQSTIRNKYTYATDTSTSCGVAASSIGSYRGSGVSWASIVNCGS